MSDDVLDLLERLDNLLTEDSFDARRHRDPNRTEPRLISVISKIPQDLLIKRLIAEGILHSSFAGDALQAKAEMSDRRSTPAPNTGSSGETTSTAPVALTKPRKSLMQEAVILGFVAEAGRARAVSNDQILAALAKAGFPEVARPSLITKLNRMKAVKTLDWDDTSRGKDIRITDGGRAHLAKLRDHYLSEGELAFLRKGVPELFP